jgi:outer membrane protein assembly factor BamB
VDGTSSPTVADGTVYVGDGDGKLYAIHTDHTESSEGSRVLLGTLGHHDTFAEQGPTQVGGGSGGESQDGDPRDEIILGETNENLSAPPSVKIAWNTSLVSSGTKFPVATQPTVVNGTIYADAGDGLYAVDAKTGEKKWNSSIGTESLPAAARGTVYVPSGPSLDALNASDGTKKWSFQPDSSPTTPEVTKDTVYVGSLDGNVYAVNAETGKERWRFTATGSGTEIRSPPAVADGTVYVTAAGGNVYALDAETGKQEWDSPNDVQARESPTATRDTVYVSSERGSYYALDASDGSVKWSFPAGTPTFDGTIYNETLYADSGLNLYALDTETGEREWLFARTEWEAVSATLSGGTVYVGGGSPLYALRASDGSKKWKLDLSPGDVEYSRPTVASGAVYISSEEGNLYAIDINFSETGA